ncbi:MAG: caspase family protein [Parachlamydia sp.]|jgi:hypothetical protein|nr:caspase family protein [Parachlamydia sp.]
MITKLLIFITILFSFNYNPIQAASLHAVLVGDSLNDSDPTGFDGGVDLWQREVKKIAALSGMDLKGVIFEDENCRIENVLAYVENMKVEDDDMILIYFAVHGSRTREKANKWPDLFFSLDRQKIDFNVFNEIVKQKGARLVISIADSCNNIVNSNGNTQPYQLKNLMEGQEIETNVISNTTSYNDLAVKHAPQELVSKYRNLFRNQSGYIVVSTSSPGEYSIKHCLTGGIFTGQLIENLRKTRMSAQITWESLLQTAKEATSRKVDTIKGELSLSLGQTPQFEIQLFNR